MHPEFPIECTCSHQNEPCQHEFATRLMKLLPLSDGTRLELSPRGLVVLGETESALERPLELIREIYRDQVCIGPLTVRYDKGATVKEPHMGVRVLCSSEHFGKVKAGLEQRGASITDSEVTPQFGVVRATAPLAALLGFPRELDQLTAARAQHVMWLSHYAPVRERKAESQVA
jgi:hypothetical protein